MNIHIDRIILRDVDIDADRAESLRSSLASELEKIMIREGIPPGLADGKFSRISAPAFDVPGSGNEKQMASSLAKSVNQAIRGIK